jgi:NodT family efflux transporter outer membrane factor (OMF) lipoprotein
MTRMIGLMALLCACSCTLGPRHPTTTLSLPPAVASTTIVPASGPPQQLVAGGVVPAGWWHQFGDPALDALVERALLANNDLASAEASLRQTRELAAAATGASLPQLDLSLQAQRTKVSRILPNPLNDPTKYLYSLNTAQLSVSYPLDLFGAGRNKIASARAAAEVARFRLAAARLTVISSLVSAVVQQASLRAQIDAANESIRSNREVLTIMQRRQSIGEIGAADVASQQTALATAESALLPLLRQLDHQRGLIAILIGVAPGSPLPVLPTLDALVLPGSLPVSMPAAIVSNRPDVRAAEAQMRAAGADVGTAIAARFPNIQLTANLGGEATNFARMFADGNPFWTVLGGLTQPLFHGGQLLHQQHAAEAGLEIAKAQYRGAVLQAFADVSDALSGLHDDANALDAATRASDAARRNLVFTRRQLALGGVGTLTVLNAAASDAQAQTQVVQARAARLTDVVSLFQALGGSPGASLER